MGRGRGGHRARRRAQAAWLRPTCPTTSGPSSPGSPSSSRRGSGERGQHGAGRRRPGRRTPARRPRGPGRRHRRPQALDRAASHLLGLQHEQGWWQGELETNVTMDAEDLLLREFLGSGPPSRPRRRRGGSGPASAPTAPGPTSAAATATCPPRSRPTWRCGWPATQRPTPHMARAAAVDQGLGRHRGHPRVHPDLAGHVRPVVLGRPARHAARADLLPAWFPLNVYDWACWARQTIVPLTIVGSLRPARPLPFGLAELRRPAAGTARRRPPPTGWTRAFQRTRPGPARLRAARPRAAPVRAVAGPRPSGGARNGSSPGRSGTAAGAASSRHGSTR